MSQRIPDTADLKESFRRCGLWRMGLSFEDVMHNDLLRRTLIMTTRARMKRQTPSRITQPALF